jgi:hypothetical protein
LRWRWLPFVRLPTQSTRSSLLSGITSRRLQTRVPPSTCARGLNKASNVMTVTQLNFTVRSIVLLCALQLAWLVVSFADEASCYVLARLPKYAVHDDVYSVRR